VLRSRRYREGGPWLVPPVLLPIFFALLIAAAILGDAQGKDPSKCR
jgi:hypothetical protein